SPRIIRTATPSTSFPTRPWARSAPITTSPPSRGARSSGITRPGVSVWARNRTRRREARGPSRSRFGPFFLVNRVSCARGSGVELDGMRQGKSKRRAFAGMAFDADIALHEVEIFSDDIEAQADAVEIAGVRFADLLEVAEDPLHVLLFDADAGVGDGELDAGQIASIADAQVDPSLGRKLESVADQVLKNFFELGHVGDDRGKILFHVPVDLQAILSVELIDVALRVGDDLVEIDAAQLHGHFLGVQPRQR